MSTILNLPDIRPSLLLDFANSGRVDPRIECVRASAAQLREPNGKPRVVGANVPRIDFDPFTKKCRGLLSEGACTNYLRYSEKFDESAWSKSNSSVEQSSTVFTPKGTPAFKLKENTANAIHYLTQNLETPANTTYAISMILKAGERTRVSLQLGGVDWALPTAPIFDLLTGTVVVGNGAITPLGDGWYECSVVGVSGSSVANRGLLLATISPNGTSPTYAGDGVSGVYVDAAQFEIGAARTSYIKTEASQVTRASDNIQLPLGDWFNPDEGTLVAAFMQPSPVAGTAVAFTGATSSNRMAIRNSGTAPDFVVQTTGDVEAQIAASIVSPNTICRAAAVYKNGTASFAANGVLGTKDNSVKIPLVDRLTIGNSSTVSHLNGDVLQVAYYPVALTDTQIQRLTAL